MGWFEEGWRDPPTRQVPAQCRRRWRRKATSICRAWVPSAISVGAALPPWLVGCLLGSPSIPGCSQASRWVSRRSSGVSGAHGHHRGRGALGVCGLGRLSRISVVAVLSETILGLRLLPVVVVLWVSECSRQISVFAVAFGWPLVPPATPRTLSAGRSHPEFQGF